MDGCRRSSVGKNALPDDDVPYGYNGANRRVTAVYPNIPRNQEATNTPANELRMTVREALTLFPTAVTLSAIFSTAAIMEG